MLVHSSYSPSESSDTSATEKQTPIFAFSVCFPWSSLGAQNLFYNIEENLHVALHIHSYSLFIKKIIINISYKLTQFPYL